MDISIQQLKVTAYEPFKKYRYEAELFIDQKKVCKVINASGKPGTAQYVEVVKGMENTLEAAQQQYLGKPDRILYFDQTGFPSYFERNMAMAIEDLVIKTHDPQKMVRDQIRLNDKMEKGIVFGHPEEPVESYKSLFHQEADLKYVLSNEHLREQFGEWFKVMRPAMWESGMIVFNNNISIEDAKFLGIDKLMQQQSNKKTRIVLPASERKLGRSRK